MLSLVKKDHTANVARFASDQGFLLGEEGLSNSIGLANFLLSAWLKVEKGWMSPLGRGKGC